MRTRLSVMALATLAAAGGAADAQAFALNEIGTCAVSRAFAATADPCRDGSAVFWNPGALATLEGFTFSAAVARIAVDGAFTRDSTGAVYDSDDIVEYPPSLFAAYRVSPRLTVAAGVYVPYGLTSAWRDDFPGRFLVHRASLRSVYVQPTAALWLDPNWSIGVGPVIAFSTVELSQALDLADQALAPGLTFGLVGVPRRTEFARASLEGSATAFGFNAGVQGNLGGVRVGVRFLSSITFDYDDGTATFRQVATDLTVPTDLSLPGGPTVPAGTPVDALLAPLFAEGGALSRQGVRTRLTHPWQLQGGIALPIASQTTLSAEVAVMGWSSFDELPVDFENPATPDQRLIEEYDNNWLVRIGAERRWDNGWTGRAGVGYSRSPAPDETVTPLLPEQDRYVYALGLGVPITGRLALDLGYLRVQGEGRRGRISERTTRDETAAMLNEGFFELTANVLSIGLRYDGAEVRR